MIKKAIQLLRQNRNLDPEVCISVAGEMMEGNAADSRIADFLISMKEKGETSTEIASFASVMRDFCVKIRPEVDGPLLDTCGTGGDNLHTFNISTAAAFVAAGAGLSVAKHGNRSVSSKCGSADILEAVGVKVRLPPSSVEKIIEKVGIGFMYAPFFHPAMKHVQQARRKMGVRTIFNILGPLTNPANADVQVVGVYSPDLLSKVAGALREMGVRKALVVHGSGMDEITSLGETSMTEIGGGQISEYTVGPEDFGVVRGAIEDLESHDLETSVRFFKEVIEGKPGPRSDIVLMNAAAAIKMCGLADDFPGGMELAGESIDSGNAFGKLEALIKETESHET